MSSTLFSLDADEAAVEVVDGVRVLTMPWTLFSLAAEIPGPRNRFASERRRHWLRERLRNAIDDAIRLGKTTDGELWDLLGRIRKRGRRGVTEFEAALEDRADSPTESWLERCFLEVLDEAGLPRPDCQQRVEADGQFVARVDFRYPDSDTVIEVSGHRHHSSRAQLERDTNRRSDLAEAGLRVIEFTHQTLVNDPGVVRRRIRRLLGRATSSIRRQERRTRR